MFRIFSNRGGKKNPSTLDGHGRGVEKTQRKKKEKEKKMEGRVVIFWKAAKAAGHEVRRALATRRAELARRLASQRRCPTERRRISVPRNVERASSSPSIPPSFRIRARLSCSATCDAFQKDFWKMTGESLAAITQRESWLKTRVYCVPRISYVLSCGDSCIRRIERDLDLSKSFQRFCIFFTKRGSFVSLLFTAALLSFRIFARQR